MKIDNNCWIYKAGVDPAAYMRKLRRKSGVFLCPHGLIESRNLFLQYSIFWGKDQISLRFA